MRIAVVSHDAGSSELLCALVKEYQEHVSWHIFAKVPSPMATICERHALTFSPIGNVHEQLEALHLDLLLFGTGWQDTCERPYVDYCRVHSIPTVAFLDHWTNYRERFGYPQQGWERNLGDFTAVHDEKAYTIAASLALPNLLKLPNYYLQNLIQDAIKHPVSASNHLLFLSEPTDAVAERTYGDPLYWGFTQYTALQEILERFEQFACQTLIIRLHPSETSSNYESLCQRYPHILVQIHDAHSEDLIDELMRARMIIGFDTMALYIAALLEKPVISYLPSATRDFLLPLPSERQLKDLGDFHPELLMPCPLPMDEFGMDFASFLQIVTKAD